MALLNPSRWPFSDKREVGGAVHDPVARSPSISDDEDDVSFRSRRRPVSAQQLLKALPIPDMRYEEGLLMSLRPFIHRSGPAYSDRSKGKGKEEAIENEALVVDAGEDLFAGPVSIEWRMAAWVIVRDQIISPFVQQGLWVAGAAVLFQGFNLARRRFGPREPSQLSRFVANWIRRLRGKVAI